MGFFDFLDEFEIQMVDETFEDPLSRWLSELEKSIENTIISPENEIDDPVLHDSVIDAISDNSFGPELKNESNRDLEQGRGIREIPVPPLRMSGGKRYPSRGRDSFRTSGRKEIAKYECFVDGYEDCPLDNRLVSVEIDCENCRYFLDEYDFSHCSLKEQEILARLDEPDEDNKAD